MASIPAIDDEAGDTVRPPPSVRIRSTHPPRVRVLLVEPSPLLQNMIARALDREGYNVMRVQSLSEVAVATMDLEPDFVLIEQNLPDGVGDAACINPPLQSVRRARFVLMSSGREADLQRRANLCGAARHFSKYKGLNALIALLNDLKGELTDCAYPNHHSDIQAVRRDD